MKTIGTFVRSVFRVFYSPRSLYRRIVCERRSESWIAVGLYGFIYLVATIWLASHGTRPFTTPWLTLKPENYYWIEAIYLFPLLAVCWICASGLIYVLGGLLGGSGNFDDFFHVMGYVLWVPWYPLIILDVINSVPNLIYNSAVGILIAFWMAQIFNATQICMKLNWVKSIVASVPTAAVTALLLFTYIR